MSISIDDAALEPEPRRTRDRNRGEKILDAARTLFRERGYHAVLIDDIGMAAGITGPGIYRHFGGKEQLLVAALDSAAEQMWRNISEEHGHLTIEDYVRSHIDWAVQNADLITRCGTRSGATSPRPTSSDSGGCSAGTSNAGSTPCSRNGRSSARCRRG